MPYDDAEYALLSQNMDPGVLEIELDDPEPVYTRPRPKRKEWIARLEELKFQANLRNETIWRNRRVTASATGFVEVTMDDDVDDSPSRQMAKLSVPHTVVNETARILGRQMPLFEVAAADSEETSIARSEKQERFIGFTDTRFQDQYLGGGGGDTLRIAKFKYMAQDGRLVQLVQPKPDRPQFPFKTRLLDPALVYYDWDEDAGEVAQCFYVTSMPIAQARREFGKSEATLPGKPGEYVNLIWYWDAEWFAVWHDKSEGALVAPTRHGYPCIPIIITHVNGLTGSMHDPANSDNQMQECYRGQGVFWPHLAEYTKWIQVVEAQVFDTIYNANPAYKKKLGPGNAPFESDIEPGKPISVPNGADVELLYKAGGLPFAKQTGELFSNIIQSGTLPIGQADFNGALERMTANQQGQSFFIPLLEAMKSHDARVYSFVLKLYKHLDMPAMTVVSGGDAGRSVRWILTPEDVDDDPYVTVEYGELAPPDLLAALNAATPAMASKLLSRYDFWHTLVRHPKAKQIADRARSEELRASKGVQAAMEEIALVTELRRDAESYEAQGQSDIAGVLKAKASAMLQQLQAQVAQPQMPQENPLAAFGQQDPMGGLGGLFSGGESGIMNTEQGAPPVPIPGMPGGNGSNGLPGQPILPGVEPEYDFGNTQSLPGQLAGLLNGG